MNATKSSAEMGWTIPINTTLQDIEGFSKKDKNSLDLAFEKHYEVNNNSNFNKMNKYILENPIVSE